MIQINQFVFNMFGVNCYVVWDDATREAAIIDPGMINAREQDALATFIEKNVLKVTQLINTHSHLDHIFGNAWVTDRYGVKVSASADDAFLASTLPEQAVRFGLGGKVTPTKTEVYLKDGDVVKVGACSLHVIAVPGHSPGGIALYDPDNHFVITGDSLFQGSIGRTDLPGGNLDVLLKAVKEKLLTLPGDTLVLPGHGPTTTIEREIKTNPYLH